MLFEITKYHIFLKCFDKNTSICLWMYHYKPVRSSGQMGNSLCRMEIPCHREFPNLEIFHSETAIHKKTWFINVVWGNSGFYATNVENLRKLTNLLKAKQSFFYHSFFQQNSGKINNILVSNCASQFSLAQRDIIKSLPFFGPGVFVRVFVRPCACTFACMCVFFHRKGFSWLNKRKECNARVQVSDGILWKCFRIKDLCLCVKENYKNNLQASNCAKMCEANLVRPQ